VTVNRSALPVLLALLSAGLLLASCESADAKRKKKGKKKPAAVEAPVPGSGNCKATPPASADLAAGLDKYLLGDWRGALGPLAAWGKSPEAAEDPAAGRGFYSLGYAHAATRQNQHSQAWYDRAEPLLVKSSEETPNLEDLYYLASLYRTRNDPAKQLAVVSKTLGLIEGGQVCAATDGDDDFRISRLLSFAGRNDERRARLEQAVEKYAKGQGRVASYHALALQELGEHARRTGDVATWEKNLRLAAGLDPAIPNVHRSIGLAMLKRGAIAEAGEYWRLNWRKERNDGNGLIYSVRVLKANVNYQKRFGQEQIIANLAEFTKEALEQNALFEARKMAQVAAKLADGLNEEETAAVQLEHDVAHYRMVQLLTAYIAGENDLQEFALQNGLLPAIHGAGLPKR
jgi:hypothetical protein